MLTPDDQARPVQFLNTPHGEIAYRHIRGEGPTILWLGGFRSDMGGSKIARLMQEADARGWDFLCFDYFAHGESEGAWDQARVGIWRDNVLSVVDQLTQGPLVAVGSSMGGWMLSLLITARPEGVRAAGFIAPAPDFATELMLPTLSPEDRRELDLNGVWMMPGYDAPVPMSQAFFDEAANHCVLKAPIAFDGPVRILHGMKDDVVPWQHGVRLLETFVTNDVQMHLIKDADHRLGRDSDLNLLVDMVAALRQP